MKKILQKPNYKKGLFILFCMMLNLPVFAQYDKIVAKDGSGDFTSVQAAIDAAPTGRTIPYKIYVKAGKYIEQFSIPATKPFIELIGESPANTILSYGDGLGGTTTFTINANDCMLTGLTLENSQGYLSDGPQSLAIKTVGDRAVFYNCRFISGQDTVYHPGNGKLVYYKNCYIDGNTDFIYGSAIAVFDYCVIYGRDRVDGSSGGIVTAANTPQSQAYGQIFRDCIIPANNGVTVYSLGRPWQNDAGTIEANRAGNKTIFLNTKMSNSVAPTGWSVWDAGTNTSLITYAEYKSVGFDGSPIDVSKRLSWSKQLSDAEAAPYYVNSNFFGSWNPYAVWSDLPAGNNFTPVIALTNFRAKRTTSQAAFLFNLAWPVSGVTYTLYRSTDNKVSYSPIKNFTINNDVTIANQFTDVLPPVGSAYYYYVEASKGTEINRSDVVTVDPAIPLNGDYRSKGSGIWTNNITYSVVKTANVITSITVTGSPSGFDDANPPSIVISGGSGTGATATAVVSGGKVTSIIVTNGGTGYTGNPTVAVVVNANFPTLPASIWEKYNSSTSTWDNVPFGTSHSNSNVTIKSGHTVTITALSSVNALVVESNAVLNATANSSLRFLSDIVNSGSIGTNSTDRISLTYSNTATTASATISGTGLYLLNSLNTLAELQNATLTIDQNLTVTNNVNALYGNSGNQDVNNITFIINTGKIVIAKALHSSGSTATAANYPKYGKYTYVINGTLDTSASTSTSSFIPYEVTGSTDPTVSLTVNGSLILGTGGLKAITTTSGTPEIGKVYLNIGDGGIVDATRATTFDAGNKFFITSGSGVLKRKVGATDVKFPVGSAGSIVANPIILNNSGVAGNFSVSVKNILDLPVSKAINKQWTVNAETSGANLSVKTQWVSADNGTFDTSDVSFSLISKTGANSWTSNTAVFGGSGTEANPYTASVSGITSFGAFSVMSGNSINLGLASFDSENNKLTVFPNPSINGKIMVNSPFSIKGATLSISSYDGRIVKQVPVLESLQTAIDVSDLANGAYILIYQNGTDKKTVKFLKL